MKKTKLMLGVAALSAALLGTGYAAMTDSILLQGKVTTADLCVQFAGGEKVDASDEIDFSIPTIDQENHRMSFEVSNIYEGAHATYKTTIKNVGTISAALAQVRIAPNIEGGYDESLAEKINVVFKMGPADNELVYKGTLKQWKEIPIERIKNIVLAAGEEVPAEITISLAEGALNTEEHSEPRTIGFNLDIDWTQKVQ